MARQRARKKKAPKTGSSLLAGLMLVSVLTSGILIIHQSDERRENYKQLTQLREQQEEQLGEYSRLLIEKESLSSYDLILKQAQERDFVHPTKLHTAPRLAATDE